MRHLLSIILICFLFSCKKGQSLPPDLPDQGTPPPDHVLATAATIDLNATVVGMPDALSAYAPIDNSSKHYRMTAHWNRTNEQPNSTVTINKNPVGPASVLYSNAGANEIGFTNNDYSGSTYIIDVAFDNGKTARFAANEQTIFSMVGLDEHDPELKKMKDIANLTRTINNFDSTITVFNSLTTFKTDLVIE